MDFMECHDYMNKDAMIYTYLLNNFTCNFKKVKAWESILLDREYVLLVDKGTLIEESEGKKKGVVRCFFSQSFIFPTKNPMKLKALEASEICLISAEVLFGKLEQEKILANFFLQIAEENERDLKRQVSLGTGNSKSKIVSTLNFLLENSLYNNDAPAFPEWLQINVLAKLANCSISTTSATINDLYNKGMLDIKTSPWKLKALEGEWNNLKICP
ncbi:TPA_asm: Crp/Fnr family transcriptional regulator [Listeria monocytogenes]|nr:Crp/Fnr family transcriptional regulator [Listeria monocytogenes]